MQKEYRFMGGSKGISAVALALAAIGAVMMVLTHIVFDFDDDFDNVQFEIPNGGINLDKATMTVIYTNPLPPNNEIIVSRNLPRWYYDGSAKEPEERLMRHIAERPPHLEFHRSHEQHRRAGLDASGLEGQTYSCTKVKNFILGDYYHCPTTE